MNIRQAVSADHLLLSTLSLDVQFLHAEAHPRVFKMPQSDDYAASFFEEMLADPTVTVFIAEEGANAVGYILCKLVERPNNPFTFPARILLVDQISVSAEARGKGIGAALLQQAETVPACRHAIREARRQLLRFRQARLGANLAAIN